MQKGKNMYEYIIGNLTEIHPAYIVVENNGIGYQIASGNPYQYSSQVNQQIKVFVHQVIREDAHILYGFNTLEEKIYFYV
ncbi:hypothetical protein GCM10025857_50130 [Alicyclobacillus contaminans]|nr:hypothetical protein GCM10025857_50130 [Alicyclobacillus contaminans]